MTVFYCSLGIYFLLIITWAIFIEPYKQLRPIEKIKKGYLYWSENFRYQRNSFLLFIHIKGLIRFWITGPVNFDKKFKKVNKELVDLEQINVHNYFLLKKAHKL